MATTLLYGTSNPAKLDSMRKILSPLGVGIIGLRDLDAPVPDVDESGASPLENARLKATAYFKAFNRPVFSCDSALYTNPRLKIHSFGAAKPLKTACLAVFSRRTSSWF